MLGVGDTKCGVYKPKWVSTNYIGRFGGLDVILQRRYGQVRR